MKFSKIGKVLCLSVFVLLLHNAAFSQYSISTTDPNTGTTTDAGTDQDVSGVYFGGQVGLSFGDYFMVSIAPLVGYDINKRLTVGGKLRYEYVHDGRYKEDIIAHNYGGSVFSNLFLIKGLYAHAEYAYMSYQYQTEINNTDYKTEREWVPFCLLGGGYLIDITSSVSFFVEVLWDVIQDDNSPYSEDVPFFSTGVTVGI